MTRIIGMMIVGEGEGDRWLSEVLSQREELVDDMIIALNNPDEKTEEIVKKTRFWSYRDDREWGRYQPQIKTDLFKRAAKLNPDWLLPSDADEIFGRNFTRKEAESLAKEEAIAWYFYVINLWGDEKHYRHDMSFPNIRYFKYRPELGMEFERLNVHPGWAPRPFYAHGWQAPFILKHYGIMKEEDREKKSERYKKYDPENKIKPDYYEKIRGEHQQTPVIRDFDEDRLSQRVRDDVRNNFKYQVKHHVAI